MPWITDMAWTSYTWTTGRPSTVFHAHQRLIHKLSTRGCQGKLLLWVESFLYIRTMRVGVRGSYSSWFDMLSGVPQGSVLGPILSSVPTVC